jgi:hypothetical protein
VKVLHAGKLHAVFSKVRRTSLGIMICVNKPSVPRNLRKTSFCLEDETSVSANKNSHKDLKVKHLQAFKNIVVE